MADDQPPPALAPQHAGDANSPKVNLNDTVGALLLGLVALVLALALWRAIENRRPLVRCTNSGISTVVSASGRFLTPLTPLFKTAWQVAEIRSPGVETVYARHGNLFAWACVGAVGLLLVPAWRRRRP